MKIHKTLALIILLFSGNLFAQNNVWLLGNKNLGSTKSSFKINFSGGFPVVTEAESQIGYHESSSVVSDENGNILMYSDGIKIFDGSHQLMKGAPQSLLGSGSQHSESTQGALSIGTSTNPERINFFTTGSTEGSNNGLRVHTIDLSKPGNGTVDNLLGEVISYDSLLWENSCEMLTAYGTCNSDSVWVVGHEKNSNNFIIILVTGDGVQSVNIQSLATPNQYNNGIAGASTGRGSLKFNSQGTKLAMTGFWPIGSHVLDFNKHEGTLGNPVRISSGFSSDINGYGVEFSPDDTKLYISSENGLYQHDLLTSTTVSINTARFKFAGLEKGRDGKIYVGKYSQSRDSYLGVIGNPNKTLSNGLSFNNNGLYVGDYVSYCIPHDIYCVPIKNNCQDFEIISQPIPQEQCRQESFILSANASNYETIKWKKQGSNTVYGTSLTYTDSDFSASDIGNWYCEFGKAGCSSLITNPVSVSESEGCIYCDELFVTTQPTGSEVCPEDTLTLNTEAEGYASVQWKKVGTTQVYGNSLDYMNADFSPSDAGEYYCEFTKTGCPNITTDTVLITESILCNDCDEFYITTQPSDLRVCPGENISLSAGAIGYDNMVWKKVGSDNVYGTSLNLTHANFSPSDAGEWYCEFFRTLCPSKSTRKAVVKESRACTTPNCNVEQRANNIWLIGRNTASNEASSHTIDFTTGSPIVSVKANAMDFYESTSVVSDENGNILMYSDGVKIYDANHTLMAGAPPSLKGPGSSYYGSTQGSLSVGTAKNPDIINFFTTASSDGDNNGLRVHTIDLSKPGNGTVDNLLGEVVSYDSLLMQNTNEMLTAYGTCNSDSTWVISHEKGSSNFIVILVTGDGVESVTKQSVPTPNKWNSGISISGTGQGTLKFNTAGTMLAMTGSYPIGSHILDFNKHTGILSNPIKIYSDKSYDINGYGVEFSPDDTKLYITSVTGLYQYNLSTNTTDLVDNTQDKLAGIETGRDGKIYLGKLVQKQDPYLGVIENPNQTLSSGLNYNDQGLFLGGYVSLCMPQDIYWVSNKTSCEGFEITSQPVPQNQCKRESFTLSASASNYETIKWKMQGSNTVYGTSQTYTNTDFSTSDIGNWYCEFGKAGCTSLKTNPVSVSESEGCIYCDELFVTTQPIGSEVCPEDTLNLNTEAEGYASIQWKKIGSTAVYGNSLDYMNADFSPSDAGEYYCEFTKTGCPNITTDTVLITESILCNNCDEFYITTQPSDLKVCPGESISLSAGAIGYDNMTWKKVGSDNVYGTSLTFTRNDFTSLDAGEWYCEFFRLLCPSKSTRKAVVEESRACFKPNCNVEQKTNNIWLLGENNNESSYAIDFTTGSPIVSETENNLGFYESNSVVSDENGNILMYSDGIKIYDGSYNLMKGAPSSLQEPRKGGAPASSVQGALSLGMASNPDIINFFTTTSIDEEEISGLRLHIIDLVKEGNGTSANPLGEVVVYDSLLAPNSCEMLTAYSTCSSDTAWVIGHEQETSNFIVILVDAHGVQSVTLQNLPTQNSSTYGYGRGSLKFNSNGTKLVMTGLNEAGTNLFDFDKHTGILSNPVNIAREETYYSYPINGYGVEFSPDDTKLYISGQFGLIQYDLLTGEDVFMHDKTLAQIEQGPDGKLYVAKWSQNTDSHLGIIENPNKTPADGANYINNGLYVGSVSYGLPQDIYWVQPRVVVTSKQKVNFLNAELFPNPTSGILNNPNQYELMVFDYQSKLILKSSEALLDVSKLNSGVYFVRYQVQEGVFNTTRIVVTK